MQHRTSGADRRAAGRLLAELLRPMRTHLAVLDGSAGLDGPTGLDGSAGQRPVVAATNARLAAGRREIHDEIRDCLVRSGPVLAAANLVRASGGGPLVLLRAHRYCAELAARGAMRTARVLERTRIEVTAISHDATAPHVATTSDVLRKFTVADHNVSGRP